MMDLEEAIRGAKYRMEFCFNYAYKHESEVALDKAVYWETEVKRLETLFYRKEGVNAE